MFKRSGLFFGLMLWMGVCGAQAILARGFGEELGQITWQSWSWALGFGSIGIMTRFHRAKVNKEVTTDFFGICSWVMVGIGAALIAFALCEYVNKVTGHRMYDWLEGAIITIASYNRDATIDWFTEKLKRFADGWSATNGAK